MRLISGLVAPILLVTLTMLPPAPVAAQTLPGLGGGSGASEASTADPVQLLLEILRDDDARDRLVEQLEAVAPSEGVDPSDEEDRPTPGRQLANFVREAGEGAISRVREIGLALVRAPRALSGLDGEEISIIRDALRELVLVIAASVGAFLVLRAIAKPFYKWVGNRVANRSWKRRILPFLGLALIDLLIVLAAWIAGATVALLRSPEEGTIGETHTLYLTAFLAVELHKLLLRLALAPATASVRLLNLSDWAARRLYGIAATLISVFGYGLLLILPLVSERTGFAQGRSTTTLIWILAIVFLGGVILYYRRPVGEWLFTQWDSDAAVRSDPASGGDAGPSPDADREPAHHRFVRPFAYGWYWIALVWLLWLFVTVLTRRPHVVNDLLAASARVALAVVAGLAVSGLLGRVIQWGISLPQAVSQRVPLLESRLNRHVPRILFVLRLLVLAAVVFYSFSALDIVRAGGWIETRLGLELTGRLFSVLLIVLAAFLVWLALTSWVDYRLNPSYGRPTAREQTLLTLLRNAGSIAILSLGLMFVLSEIGLNIGPLIASAGVVGLAIGFGAQKMVQDIITGIFIQFEKAINVGDVVSAGGITGAVERLTVRSVSLRDLSGIYHIIPFSSVDTVSNYTRDFSYWVIDMGIAYREDVGEARQALFDAFEEIRTSPEYGGFILGDLEWFGLDSFGDNAVMLKARIKTWPAQQWAVGRAYNEIVKRVFDERGIEIPFPQRTLWFGEDKEGGAPPLRVKAATPVREGPPARETRDDGSAPHVTTPTQDAPPDAD